MASERRPPPNQALDLLQTLLETPPSPAVQHSPKQTPDRARAQAQLDTPFAPSYARRPPVTLRSADTFHSPRLARVAPTWFDTLLQRASQVLLLGALLVLGYWFVNVPLSNWLHPLPVPVARAVSVRPSATATRVAPTKTASHVSNTAPAVAQPSPQNTPTAAPPRASATPSSVSAEVHAQAPRATELITVEQIPSTTPAITETSSAIPAPTASPRSPAPTVALPWPTIPPVQLGVVSKPSPEPAPTKVISAPPVAATKPNGTSAMPTRLIIPAIGLDVPIKEVFIVNNQWEIAQYAAGYMNGSGLPGVPGNLAISGHAGLYGAVFASLGALNPGDDIYVDAAGKRYHYRLRIASAVWPNQTEVLDSTETPTMTLITCTNWDTQRLIAQADFVDAVAVPDA